MSWVADAPSGVYKNHALSKNVREAAWANCQVMQYLNPEPNFGAGKGENVTVTRFRNLPLAGRVNELDLLPEGVPPVDTMNVTVAEWGFKVPVTHLEEKLTHYNRADKIQRMLKRQMTLTMDVMAADALKSGLIKVHSDAADTFVVTTNGTFAGAATHNLSVAHLRELWDYMHGDLKIPLWPNGTYIGLMSTLPARGIKSDDTYKDWTAPTDGTPIIKGQLPKQIEGFTLIETNHFDAFDNDLPAGGVKTGEAVFFGEDAGFLAEVMTPELRAEPATDLGRFRYLGWVGVIEAGNTWGNDASNARVIHWGSTA